MTKTRNISLRKIATLFVMILIITTMVFALSSCGGSSKIADKSEKETDIEFVARVISSNTNQMYRFIAASRGYDIAAEDFNEDSIVSNTVILPVKLDVAKAALDEVIQTGKFKKSESKAFLTAYKDALTEGQVFEIAREMSVEYDLEVDPGIFDYILIGIGKALGWMTKILAQQYILAIMVFAVIVEILMLPVSIKQQKNSIGMAKLRPKMMKIEKKYAGRTDQATMRKKQEEIMELQKTEGYSPFAGCLPLLLQLIIVGFVLYPIIQNPLRYMLGQSEGFSQALIAYATSSKALGGLGMTLSSKGNVIELLSVLNAENIEGIKNFSLIANGQACYDTFMSIKVPNFTLWGLNIGKVPKFIDVLVIVPILNVAFQFVTMKLSRKWMGNANPAAAAAGDTNSQVNASLKMMDIVMPLMTLVIMFQVPALIGIYWLFRSVLSLLKQYIIKTALPIPSYTEDELKEMEKIEKERKKAEKAIIKSQPKYRSLHYIDEEDYEELPEIKSSGKREDSKTISSDKPEIKD